MHLLLRYTQALITQTSQNAVCNRHHSVDQQICRTLLVGLDHTQSGDVLMTHELMATILGVRREGVSEGAFRLQNDGLIRYARGHISVLDRRGLEQRACECYMVIKRNTSDCFPQGSLRQVRLSAIANREITVRHASIFPVGPTCIERFLLERQRRRRTKGVVDRPQTNL